MIYETILEKNLYEVTIIPQSVLFHDDWLPDKCFEGVTASVSVDINTHPGALGLRVQRTELIDNIRGVEASVVRQLARNYFQRMGIRINNELPFVFDGFTKLTKVFTEFHLNRSAPPDDIAVIFSPLHNHDRIM